MPKGGSDSTGGGAGKEAPDALPTKPDGSGVDSSSACVPLEAPSALVAAGPTPGGTSGDGTVPGKLSEAAVEVCEAAVEFSGAVLTPMPDDGAAAASDPAAPATPPPLTGHGVQDTHRLAPQDFDLLCFLGKGAYGRVLQVVHRASGVVYAMKVMNKEKLITMGQVRYTKVERDIMTRIEHPFLVNLKCAFQTETKLFLVMDFLPGGELFTHLRDQHMLLEDAVRVYAAEMVLAIEYLHNHDVIHRDLKPENVLLDADGHLRLTDYGLAKAGHRDEDRTNTLCGTNEYMAPEMLAGGGYGKAVDWWSFGALLYEMLTGAPPFQAKERKRLYDKIMKSKLSLPQYLSAGCHSLLKGLLERNVERRLGAGKSTMFQSRGVVAIKKHRFFKGLNWQKLERKEIKAPIKVGVTDMMDTRHFDADFTSVLPSLSPKLLPKPKTPQQGKKGKGGKGKKTPLTSPPPAIKTPPSVPRMVAQLVPLTAGAGGHATAAADGDSDGDDDNVFKGFTFTHPDMQDLCMPLPQGTRVRSPCPSPAYAAAPEPHEAASSLSGLAPLPPAAADATAPTARSLLGLPEDAGLSDVDSPTSAPAATSPPSPKPAKVPAPTADAAPAPPTPSLADIKVEAAGGGDAAPAPPPPLQISAPDAARTESPPPPAAAPSPVYVPPHLRAPPTPPVASPASSRPTTPGSTTSSQRSKLALRADAPEFHGSWSRVTATRKSPVVRSPTPPKPASPTGTTSNDWTQFSRPVWTSTRARSLPRGTTPPLPSDPHTAMPPPPAASQRATTAPVTRKPAPRGTLPLGAPPRGAQPAPRGTLPPGAPPHGAQPARPPAARRPWERQAPPQAPRAVEPPLPPPPDAWGPPLPSTKPPPPGLGGPAPPPRPTATSWASVAVTAGRGPPPPRPKPSSKPAGGPRGPWGTAPDWRASAW